MDEMPLSINLDKSRSRRIKANRFTNREIREALDTPGYLDKKQTTEFATELPRRASFSLACIVFALIGVPLAINTRRKDTSTGFALGILIASLYFLSLIHIYPPFMNEPSSASRTPFIIILILLLAITGVQYFFNFNGLGTDAAMDHAQIARNVARCV